MRKWVCGMLLVGAWGCSAGGGAKDAGEDAGQTGCTGNAPACVDGTPGGQCGDALLQSECVNAQWECPAGTIEVEQCACWGLPAPGCSCTPNGWSCRDAGLPQDAGVSKDGGSMCSATPDHACVGGTPGGQCGDALLVPECINGQWACPQGTIPTSQCACLGLPAPGCSCTTNGWECPDAGA